MKCLCSYYWIVFLLIFCIQIDLYSNQYEYHHLIMYGQSLSIGYQSYPAISVENVEGNYMIGDQIWFNYGNSLNTDDFYPLNADIANSYKNVQNQMSRRGYIAAECPLFGTVNHLQMKGDVRYVATSCGTSGRSIEELSKESETKAHYLDFSNTIKYANLISRKKKYHITCPAIFFMQGEWNYSESGSGLKSGTSSTSNKEKYKGLLVKLKDNMQNYIIENYKQSYIPQFITYQTGAQYTKGKTIPIGMAQLEASNALNDIICAGPVYPMTDRGGHLDSNGYRWFGEMMGKVFYKTYVLGQEFYPLQPLQISRTDDPRCVKLKMFVPQLPLVLDTWTLYVIKDYGFELFLNDMKQEIVDVSVINDEIFITCSKNLIGKVEIVYAGESNNGNGNLRDSDDYQSNFNYIDLDEKNEDGDYIFQREISETTLRPSYEPQDKDGNIIYNKPYPLQNWCVAFYYKLETDEDVFLVPDLTNKHTSIVKNVSDSLILIRYGEDLIVRDSGKNLIGDEGVIEIYNTRGQLILNIPNARFFNGERRFSLSGLFPGMYYALYRDTNLSKGLKFIL